MTIFDGARDHSDPGLPLLHPDRLACGGSIAAPSARHSDRLHAWFQVFWYGVLAVFVLAVIYVYCAVTP